MAGLKEELNMPTWMVFEITFPRVVFIFFLFVHVRYTLYPILWRFAFDKKSKEKSLFQIFGMEYIEIDYESGRLGDLNRLCIDAGSDIELAKQNRKVAQERLKLWETEVRTNNPYLSEPETKKYYKHAIVEAKKEGRDKVNQVKNEYKRDKNYAQTSNIWDARIKLWGATISIIFELMRVKRQIRKNHKKFLKMKEEILKSEMPDLEQIRSSL
jgi:hypothetical protein